MSKCYPIESSPLYRLRNRRKLAELLNLPKNYFKEEHAYCYNEFSRKKYQEPDFIELKEKRDYITLSRCVMLT